MCRRARWGFGPLFAQALIRTARDSWVRFTSATENEAYLLAGPQFKHLRQVKLNGDSEMCIITSCTLGRDELMYLHY